MQDFIIEVEVSLRDCIRFQELLNNTPVESIYGIEIEQISSNTWIFKMEDYIPDVEEFIDDLKELTLGMEVEYTPEY